MIVAMEPGDSSNSQPEYDIFRQDSSLERLEVVEENSPKVTAPMPPNDSKKRRKLRKRILIGLAVLLFAAGISLIVKTLSKPSEQPPTTVVINTQSLDNGTLNQVTPDNGSGVKQQLTISPETIFKNNVSFQGSAEIAKDLTVNGKVNIQGATTLQDSLTVRNALTVGGNLTVNGLITAGSLNVGSLTLSSINLSSNLVFGGHIVPNGSQPSVRASSAAGGGTVSISGNDTAGTITITTGGSGLVAGELAIITFRTAFATTPKVQLTPLNAAASGLRYYATHTASFFTVNISTAPAGGTTYIFDYLVTQ